MPSRGIPTTYTAPPFEPEDSGLIGPRPGCPVPCSNVIFSSSVISFTTSAARSSGERLVFIQGDEDLADCDCPRNGSATLNTINSCRTQPPRLRSNRGMSIPLDGFRAKPFYITRSARPFTNIRSSAANRVQNIYSCVYRNSGAAMKRVVLGLVLLFSLHSFAADRESPLISNVGARATINLDGVWNTIIDPYETGLSSRFFENTKPKSKSDLVEYDFDHSPKLRVPGDWNSQRESLLFYEGPMWYQRYFSYQKRAHVRTFLYFGAANYLARVWLNGTKLGEHVGGFTPFDFEITDEIEEGANSLVVEVDNTRRADGVPSLHTDWWNYGGLTRSVELVEVPETFIQDYSVQLAKGRSDLVEGWVRVNNSKPGTRITVEIPELHLVRATEAEDAGKPNFDRFVV